LLIIFVFAVPAYSWSDTGHMAVAYVAYQKLTPQARARVDALVRLNPRFSVWNSWIPQGTPAAKRRLMLFMIAATWPDQIKSLPGFVSDGPDNGNRPPTDGTADRNVGYSDMSMHKYWHFIDKPFSPDGTALENPDVPNAETQIAAFRAVLASNSPDELKSYDLVWLLHLVGDVHQPLHATSRFTHATPHGDAYAANDPELLAWVQATALHGFVEAHHAYVRPLDGAARNAAIGALILKYGTPAERLGRGPAFRLRRRP